MNRQIVSGLLLGLLFLTLIPMATNKTPCLFAQEIHDVAVTGVFPQMTSVEVPGYLEVTVQVDNQGNQDETINLTIYLDSPSLPYAYMISFLPSSSAANVTMQLYLGIYDVGIWDLVASLTGVDGETDLEDNVLNYGEINVNSSFPLHNVAAFWMEVPQTVVRQDSSLSISTIVGNTLPFFSETFDLIVYANETVVGTSTNITLAPDTSANVTVMWDTSSFAHDYLLSANATVVDGESDLYDNTCFFGFIRISCTGDINGDFVTDAKDFVLVKKAIPSTPGSPNWNPNANMNDDGVIDAKDYQIVKNHIPSIFP